MRRLINWFNILIKKRKELKRWQRIVTVLAAVITFATTYALILPAITVEKDNTGEVAGMYLEKTADLDVLQEENALEPIGVSIAADMDNAVTFAYSDDDMTATAVFSTDEEIPEGTELVVNLVAPESEEYADLRSRSVDLLDKEFIYDVTTCSFYDYALVCDNVDVTPKTGLVDIQIIFRNNTVEHVNDMLFAGRFARPAEEVDGFMTVAADVSSDQDISAAGNENAVFEDRANTEDELVAVNSDESSVIELTDGIITSLALKGTDLTRNDSIVGILAGNVDEETKAAAAETDAEIPDSDGTQEASEVSGSTETDGEEISTALPVKTLKVSGSDYTVTLSYDESSGIPDEAVLAVSEIAQDSKEYQTYLKEAKKAMRLKEEETLPSFAARFFDIKIMVDNQEFTPETGVSVEITYTEPLAEHPDTEVSAVHFADESAEAEVIEANTAEIQDDGQATVEFTAESFSVYGVIYTVDFHYEINGKMYEFSIPGGGFVSLEHVVEVLGIATVDENSENGVENAENGAENSNDFVGEVPGVDVSDENGEGNADVTADGETNSSADSTAYEEAIKLNEVEVSEATRKFVADVVSVEFSSPELVWVGKVDSATTVGGLKEANGLEVEYSADLTEEQIAEINAQTVEAGDWALISVQPFTSEETLTVTMKNGDQFVVKVTDAQISTHVITADGEDYIITVTYGPEAGIPDGAELHAEEILKGTEEYNSYIEKASQAINEEGYISNFAFARFFDISITASGRKIEPLASVEVSVQYSNSITIPEGDRMAVHFADSGLEVLGMEEEQGDFAEEGLSSSSNGFVFEQSSFSVTGTVVTDWQIENGGEYLIVYGVPGSSVKYRTNNQWVTIGESGAYYYFALDGNGETKPIVYDPNTGKFTFIRDDEMVWKFNYIRSDGYNNYWNIYCPGTNKYMNLGNNSLTGRAVELAILGAENSTFNIINTSTWNSGLAWQPIDETKTSKNGLKFIQNQNYANVMLVKVEDTNPTFPVKQIDTTSVDYDIDVLDQWLKKLKNSDTTFGSYSKSARCIDEKDRIYQVDLAAASGKYAFGGTLDLSFILDVSASMKFPADLEPVSNTPVAINQNTMKNSPFGGGNKTVYYAISDVHNTSTVYAIYNRNGTWYQCDASTYDKVNNKSTKTTGSGREIVLPDSGNMQLRVADGTNPTYIIYRATEFNDTEMQRLDYLEANMGSTIDVLKEISKIVGDTTSEISYVSFAKTVQKYGSGLIKDGISLDYTTASGTRQDRGLDKAREYFGAATDGKTKYAILITDGAPVHDSSDTPSEYIDNDIVKRANELKAKGVTLITIGLSTENVTNGHFILYEIASTDDSGQKLFYEAKDGHELQYILKDILELILAKATVTGTATDTIDEAFYPVDANGNPLDVGETITVNGVTGTIGRSGNNYTVTWGNADNPVEFPWNVEDDNTKNGWTGSFYIKAKEDFLGGNDINTNKDATITADKFLVRNSEGDIIVGPKDIGSTTTISGTDSYIASDTNKLPSPVVNVDDLTMTDESTTWTVYKGTSVDPKDEINRIYNAIKINEVVTETRDDNGDGNPDHVIRTDDGMNIGQAGGEAEQFYLKDLTGLASLNWNNPLLFTEGYTVPYSKYGHSTGNIRVKVEAIVGTTDTLGDNPHVVNTIGEPVEQYKLTVSYEPNPETIPYAQSHITKDGYKGTAITDTAYRNTHTINVIAKDLEVTKVGPDGETVISNLPAKFTLYKESENGTYVDGLPSGKKYEAVEVTTSNGVASWDYLEPAKAADGAATYWEPETVFYIKETDPPTGYAAYSDFIMVKLDVTETTPVIGNTGSEPYNATQTATVTIIGDTVEAGHEDEAYVKVTSTEGNTVKFTVKNDLPTDITLKKIDKTTRENIPGAKFSLKKGREYVDLSKLTIVNLDSTGNPTTTAATIETIHRTNPAVDIDVIVVPATGIKISGLTNGDYTLKEEVAPDGYIITDSGTTFTATNGKVEGESNHIFTVENEPGAALPNTGGSGTTALYLLGIMLTAFAGTGLVIRKRRRDAA